VPVAQPGVPPGYQQKDKMAAGLLGIFLGYLGIHNFYLGNTTKGIIQLVLTLTCIGYIVSWIWGIVEGIMILTGSIDRDANGVPLKG
jgi:TM2 domain-containing membrane protein YozV